MTLLEPARDVRLHGDPEPAQRDDEDGQAVQPVGVEVAEHHHPLTGGPGADTLTGGGGKDSFVFAHLSDGIDRITDFSSGSDRLEVSADGFGGGLVAGAGVSLVRLADVAGYVDSGRNGVLLLDKSGDDAGTLYWDANGGSSADAVAFVRLGGSSLLDDDFRIV